MFQGRLEAIFLATYKQGDRQQVQQAEAVAGGGLVGDHFFRREGRGKPDQEITLIETETLESLARDGGVSLAPNQTRRNLLTRGVPLNHLVNREFTVGNVLFRGLRLCEPCKHLEALTCQGIKDALCHRGGLRAEILRGGVLRLGDCIRPHPDLPNV